MRAYKHNTDRNSRGPTLPFEKRSVRWGRIEFACNIGLIGNSPSTHETNVCDTFVALPDVTLGACALFLWDDLEVSVRNEFAMWREAPGSRLLKKMANDLKELIALRAEVRPFDFVTAPPAARGTQESEAAQRLAAKVAELIGVPYRQVLVASEFSPVVGHTEPTLGAPVKKGACVLLVVDLIQRGTTLRNCIRRLSEAGASVQVVGWAARSPA